ncbi:DUF4340 domain-containing protein [Chloroflexota bacterium]
MRLRNILILVAILLALGGYVYFSNMPEPPEEEEPRPFVWIIDMNDIQHITVSLPREGKSESFIKVEQDEQFPWFFDDAERSEVDIDRWGGGIPLLLSGPGADRIISENTSDEKLAEFGLVEPLMRITLTLIDGRIMNIDVGDKTPNEQNNYVKAPGTRDVALVYYGWCDVLERLVLEPPYASASDD